MGNKCFRGVSEDPKPFWINADKLDSGQGIENNYESPTVMLPNGEPFSLIFPSKTHLGKGVSFNRSLIVRPLDASQPAEHVRMTSCITLPEDVLFTDGKCWASNRGRGARPPQVPPTTPLEANNHSNFWNKMTFVKKRKEKQAEKEFLNEVLDQLRPLMAERALRREKARLKELRVKKAVWQKNRGKKFDFRWF